MNSKHLLWLLLAIPAVPMIWPVLWGDELYRYAIRPSGIACALLLLLVLAITPLRRLMPASGRVKWLAVRRRYFGVAAFLYACVHLVFFLASIGRLDYVLQGLVFASMWTGWLAFLLLAPLAATSNDPAVRKLDSAWKKLHRLVYPAVLLVFAHWLLLAANPWEAFGWFAPLALLQMVRMVGHMAGNAGKRGKRP